MSVVYNFTNTPFAFLALVAIKADHSNLKFCIVFPVGEFVILLRWKTWLVLNYTPGSDSCGRNYQRFVEDSTCSYDTRVCPMSNLCCKVTFRRGIRLELHRCL